VRRNSGTTGTAAAQSDGGKALENSKIVILQTQQEAVDLLNEYAAEHLIVSCADAMLLRCK